MAYSDVSRKLLCTGLTFGSLFFTCGYFLTGLACSGHLWVSRSHRWLWASFHILHAARWIPPTIVHLSFFVTWDIYIRLQYPIQSGPLLLLRELCSCQWLLWNSIHLARVENEKEGSWPQVTNGQGRLQCKNQISSDNQATSWADCNRLNQWGSDQAEGKANWASNGETASCRCRYQLNQLVLLHFCSKLFTLYIVKMEASWAIKWHEQHKLAEQKWRQICIFVLERGSHKKTGTIITTAFTIHNKGKVWLCIESSASFHTPLWHFTPSSKY